MIICNKKNISQEIIDIIGKMREYAHRNNVPIVADDSLSEILAVIAKKRAPRILEIGTAIGYSALSIVINIPESAVVTVERDKKMLSVAEHFLAQVPAHLSTNIKLCGGDALDEKIVKHIAEMASFDVIFIDGAKAQYKNFFITYAPFLQAKGVVISDNVNFRNLVTKNKPITNRRLEKIGEKIAKYNDWLKNHEQYTTEFFNCGDGLAVTTKK